MFVNLTTVKAQSVRCSEVKLRGTVLWLGFLITEGYYNKITALILKIRL